MWPWKWNAKNVDADTYHTTFGRSWNLGQITGRTVCVGAWYVCVCACVSPKFVGINYSFTIGCGQSQGSPLLELFLFSNKDCKLAVPHCCWCYVLPQNRRWKMVRAARQCAFYCVVPQASGTMFGGTREIRGCNGASQVWSTAAKSPRRSVSHGTSGGVGTGESAIRRSDRLLLDQSPGNSAGNFGPGFWRMLLRLLLIDLAGKESIREGCGKWNHRPGLSFGQVLFDWHQNSAGRWYE